MVIGKIKCEVVFTPASGFFEVTENGSVVVKGTIQAMNEPIVQISDPEPSPNTGGIRLKSTEVYRDLRLRGYHYGGIFRGILDASNTGNSFVIAP